jgi:hypothetical protein
MFSELNNPLLDEYREKTESIFANGNHNKYYFEMTKCCGYAYIQPFFKKNTLEELYHNIELELSHLKVVGVYLKNVNGERLDIPRDSSTTILDFFIANQKWFVPIYPLPAKVIYRVYFDDSCPHTHCSVSENFVSNMDITEN